MEIKNSAACRREQFTVRPVISPLFVRVGQVFVSDGLTLLEGSSKHTSGLCVCVCVFVRQCYNKIETEGINAPAREPWESD